MDLAREKARAVEINATRAAELAKAKGEKGKGDGLIIEIVSDGKRQVIQLPPGSRVISGGEQEKHIYWQLVPPGGPMPPVPPPGLPPRAGQPVPVDPTEKRIADLEKRLEELMRAVKELHGELKGAKPVPPTPPARVPGRTEVPKPLFEVTPVVRPLAPPGGPPPSPRE